MKTLSGTKTGTHRRSGQALTEAVITLCLLSFTWLVTAYMLTLAENRVRSAAIGRHSAWMQAHNPGSLNPTQAAGLSTFFIRHENTINPSGAQSQRAVDGSVTGTDAFTLGVLNQLGINPIKIQRKTQTLGVVNSDNTALKRIDQKQFLFMRGAIGGPSGGTFKGISSIGIATCEWAHVEFLLEDEAEVKTALGLPP